MFNQTLDFKIWFFSSCTSSTHTIDTHTHRYTDTDRHNRLHKWEQYDMIQLQSCRVHPHTHRYTVSQALDINLWTILYSSIISHYVSHYTHICVLLLKHVCLSSNSDTQTHTHRHTYRYTDLTQTRAISYSGASAPLVLALHVSILYTGKKNHFYSFYTGKRNRRQNTTTSWRRPSTVDRRLSTYHGDMLIA